MVEKYAILVSLSCFPNPATERGRASMEQILINLIVTVVADVIADRICKWLDCPNDKGE